MVMTYPTPAGGPPRRSQRGPQSAPPAAPRRAYVDEPPILAGYTYVPGRTETPPPLPAAASEPILPSEPPPVSIEDFKPKRNTVWFVLLGIVLVLAIGAGILINNHPMTVSPTGPTTTPIAYPTPTRTGGTGFADSSSSGYWKITNTTWGASGVQLTLEITVDTGRLYYQFYAYTQAGDVLEPVPGSPSELQPGFVPAGQTVTGTLTFQAPRQPLTLIMVSTGQNQLSALPVSG